MAYPNDEWQRKGATLSDKTARQEFGLTQDEIYDAIDAGTLHYRQAAMHGNPWLRLLRREVEALARTSRGDRYVDERQARAELARVNHEIRRLQTELAALEERQSKLSSDIGLMAEPGEPTVDIALACCPQEARPPRPWQRSGHVAHCGEPALPLRF
jgi:hypothetical protein